MPEKPSSNKSPLPIDSPKRGGGARRVYETLRDEIIEMKQAPGSALDETSLSLRFSLSRSPIREALVRLSSDGYVQTLSNRSTIVTPLDVTEFPRFVEALDYVQRAVTRLASRSRNEADLEIMTALAKTYDEACKAGNRLNMSAGNKAFHMAIAKAGKNRYLADAYGRLLDEGRRILHLHYSQNSAANDPFPLSPEHYEMIEAIRNKSETEADRLAHEHTRIFHERLVEFMRVKYVHPMV